MAKMMMMMTFSFVKIGVMKLKTGLAYPVYEYARE
jgi:hypothetical protein